MSDDKKETKATEEVAPVEKKEEIVAPNENEKQKEEAKEQPAAQSSLSLNSKENANPYVQVLPPNPRGLPSAPFIRDIEGFMKSEKASVDDMLREMQTTYSKYKFMESQLVRSREAIKSKLPEIKKTLEMVKILASKKTESCHFELANQVYANANLKGAQSVVLSLGANVMVEYSFEEATQLLEDQLRKSDMNLRHLHEDTQFLKEQITTCEVNTARIYNWDVKERRIKKV